MEELFQTGVTSFKLYMTYNNMAVNDGELYEVLKEAGRLGALVGVHCENGLLIKELVKEQKETGRLGPMAHPLSRPAPIEEEAIQRLAVIAGLAGAPVMVVHLSTKAGYEQIEAARRRGQTVYTETCPQYLLMDDSLYLQQGFEGAKYVISPPLRKREDQECLWKALQNNEIQTVCTDHCSFTLAQKAAGRADFTKMCIRDRLMSEKGQRKDVGRGQEFYVLLNKADGPKQLCLAGEVAQNLESMGCRHIAASSLSPAAG